MGTGRGGNRTCERSWGWRSVKKELVAGGGWKNKDVSFPDLCPAPLNASLLDLETITSKFSFQPTNIGFFPRLYCRNKEDYIWEDYIGSFTL